MKGVILDYSFQKNEGFISGSDNARYAFSGADWRATEAPTRGMTVDFEPQDASARNVFPVPAAPPPIMPPPLNTAPAKNNRADKKVAAGVCGILLGCLGVHKFILGYTTEGLIMLLCTLLTCGLAGCVFGIIGLIEGIIYLTKSDDEFVQIYVDGRKGWF